MNSNQDIEVDPRVALAAERTVLAWFRTGIALMAFGFVVARFGVFLREMAALRVDGTERSISASVIGFFIVGAGIAVNVWASARHHFMIRRLVSGEPFRASSRAPVAVGVASGIGGVILLAVLASALVR